MITNVNYNTANIVRRFMFVFLSIWWNFSGHRNYILCHL